MIVYVTNKQEPRTLKFFGLGSIFIILKQVFYVDQGCICLIQNRALNSNIMKYFENNKTGNMVKSPMIVCVIYYAWIDSSVLRCI